MTTPRTLAGTMFLILMMTGFGTFAQTETKTQLPNLSIDMRAGAGGTLIKFPTKKETFNGGAGGFQIALSNRFKEHFFIRTEMGFSFYETKLTETLLEKKYDGTYNTDKAYFSILPEYRFGKNEMLFVNAGVSLVKDLNNIFRGTVVGAGDNFDGIRMYGTGSCIGYGGNVGLRLMLNRGDHSLGLIQSIGYTYLSSQKVPGFMEMAFHNFSYKIGMTCNIL